MDKDREVALVRRCQNGDRQAMDSLVRLFEKPVFSAAYRMLGNADEASDVSQTAFVKFFENIRRFDPNFRLFSWIYRITVNEALDQLRRRRRFEPLTESAQSDGQFDGQFDGMDGDSSQEAVATSQLCREVQGILMHLQKDHRAVIVLHYFSACSYRQISEILEVPEKTVKSRLFSARRQMKSLLEQHGILSS